MPLFFAKTNAEFKEHSDNFSEPLAGALVCFSGRVRKFNQNKEVDHLFYEAYEALAQSMFAKLEMLAKERFFVLHSRAVHRIGKVSIGRDAVTLSVWAMHRHEAFIAARFLIDELKKSLPIWKKEVYVDGSFTFVEGDCLCAITKENALSIMNPPRRALAARQISINILANKKILLVGAGGLGCPLAINLSALGIEEITIFDADLVESRNLARQFIFSLNDVGVNKATLVKRFIEERFFCQVIAHNQRLSEEVACKIMKDFHLVIDATDCPISKNMLKKIAYDQGIPLISASVYQSEGEVHVFTPNDAQSCLQCFKRMQEENRLDSCQEIGVLTHACSIVAAVAAEKALGLLSQSLANRCEITLVDVVEGFMKTMPIAKDKFCHCCSSDGANKNKSKKLVRLVR